jgi:hypothetical protein
VLGTDRKNCLVHGRRVAGAVSASSRPIFASSYHDTAQPEL